MSRARHMKRANGGAVYSGAGSNVVKEAEEKEQHKAGGKVVGKVMGSKPMKRLDKRARGGRIDLKQDKKMVSSAVHKHEKNMHKGENETKLKSGGKVGSDKSPFAPESARRPFSSASR